MNERKLLETNGWTEDKRKSGQWRWTKREWVPVVWYTQREAVSLQLATKPKVQRGN